LAPLTPEQIEQLDRLQAEVVVVRDDARGATARADEALRRVTDVRADLVRLEDRVEGRMSWLDGRLGEVEVHLVARLDRIEAESRDHRTQVVGHLHRLWEAAEALRDRPVARDMSGLYVVAVVGALALQSCPGGHP